MKFLKKFFGLFWKTSDAVRYKEFPSEFYRGISTKDSVSSGYITEGAFRFDQFGTNPERTDNFRELSINWNDSDESLKLLLNQHKPWKEDKQFSVGYAKLSLSEVRNAFRVYISNGDFMYERRPVHADKDKDIAENPFHGNLLINKDLNSQNVRIIQCTLANIATAGLTLRR